MSTLAQKSATRTAAGRRIDWHRTGVQVALFAAYCQAFLTVRLAFSAALTQDDAARHFEAQALLSSYGTFDPPLYTWLLWMIQRLVGPGLHSSLLLNYALMIGTFWALLATARMVIGPGRWASLAAWSLVLLPVVMLSHFALAHTTQVLFASALALLLLMRVVRNGGMVDYALLGAAIGHGFLAKHNFGLFLLTVILAVAIAPEARRRIVPARLVLTVVAALLVALPHLIALAEISGQANRWLSAAGDHGLGPLAARMRGMISAGSSLLAYTWPLLLTLAIAWPRPADRNGDRQASHHIPAGGPDPCLAALLGRFLLSAVIVIAGTVLVLGLSQMLERYMQPVLFATPLLAVLWIVRRGGGTGPWRRYAACLIVAGLAGFGLRMLELSPFCPQACRDLVPYDRLAAELRANGFADGTIVTGSVVAAGNLRAALPDARVLIGRRPAAVLPAGKIQRADCVAVWDGMDWQPDHARRVALAPLGLTLDEATERTRSVTADWQWPMFTWTWPPAFETRPYTWHYVARQAGDRLCP